MIISVLEAAEHELLEAAAYYNRERGRKNLIHGVAA